MSSLIKIGKYKGKAVDMQATVKVRNDLMQVFADAAGFSLKKGKKNDATGRFSLRTGLKISQVMREWEICVSSDGHGSVVKDGNAKYWSIWVSRDVLDSFPLMEMKGARFLSVTRRCIVFDLTANTQEDDSGTK